MYATANESTNRYGVTITHFEATKSLPETYAVDTPVGSNGFTREHKNTLREAVAFAFVQIREIRRMERARGNTNL
jgi:hypothetical protein